MVVSVSVWRNCYRYLQHLISNHVMHYFTRIWIFDIFYKLKNNIFAFMKPNLTPTELPKYSKNIFHWNTRMNVVLANNKVCTKKRCSKYLKLEEIQWFNNASDLLRFPDIFMCPLYVCLSFRFDAKFIRLMLRSREHSVSLFLLHSPTFIFVIQFKKKKKSKNSSIWKIDKKFIRNKFFLL